MRNQPVGLTIVHSTVLCLLIAVAGRAQTPPDAPIILDPPVDGEIVAASDVHMETAAMLDADPGDSHLCTDWEIWSVTPAQLAWSSLCVLSATERTHIHLGDGAFLNTHAGRTELFADTDYELRVRFCDQSGLWGDWAQRPFRTGPASEIFPLALDDVAAFPWPRWQEDSGLEVELPGGMDPGHLRLESDLGALLLEFAGQDASGNVSTNPPAVAAHRPVRVRLSAGAGSLLLPQSTLVFTEDSGEDLTVYLPPVNLQPLQETILWISNNGSSYWGDASPTQPDFSWLARGTAVPWSVLQPGYEVEVVATGFQLPVFLAFVPAPGSAAGDPYLYVSELYGTIKVVTRDGSVSDYATGLLNFDPFGPFPGSGEKGLGGMVVDPATGDLLVGVLHDTSPPNGPHCPRVIRLTSLDGGRTAASQTTLLDMPNEPLGASHFISDLSLGPDGKLYVHIGDGLDTARALDLDSFRGKILRMEVDGSAPTDNPFHDAQDGINATDYIFAYGFRNPFGGAWRAADGAHYEVENGPSRNDRLARVDAGVGYGWSGDPLTMELHAIYNWFIPHAPVEMTFIEPQTFGGSGFPADKQDHAFVTESGPTWASGWQELGKRIVEFEIGVDGTLVNGPTTLVEYNGAGRASAAGLVAGPDGLYFTDLYKDVSTSAIDRGANVLRVRFVGIADFEADVTRGNYPLAVQFTDLSSIPNATGWMWYFGDGGSSTLQNPQHVYTAFGYYDVRLEVSTANGLVVQQKNAYIVAANETAVQEEATRPVTWSVRSAPNPFVGGTLVRYDLPAAAPVRLRIFDVSGRLVQNLVDAEHAAGVHTVVWNGRDRQGRRVASGVYFLRLDAGHRTFSQRLVRSR